MTDPVSKTELGEALSFIRDSVANANDEDLVTLLIENGVSLAVGALLNKCRLDGRRRILADLRGRYPEWFEGLEEEPVLPQPFVPAREGDVFVPIRFEHEGFAADIARSRPFEHGNVIRSDSGRRERGDPCPRLLPAKRFPDGSVLVLDLGDSTS